jgi:Zn-dependent peptidase ImmA (M78 family)
MSKQKNGNLPRGFKTQANELAIELRQELGIERHKPLCPKKLASHLLIPICPLSEFGEQIPEAVRYFQEIDLKTFSAVTVFDKHKRLIVYNDAHSVHRQAADLSHELSHAILDHRPDVVFNIWGCRNFNKEYEDQANWLGPTLLIPNEAALHIVRANMDKHEAAKHYGVSLQIVNMRLNLSGALKRYKTKK